MDALLSYSIEPAEVEYSALDPIALSIVDLTITATNLTTADVSCSFIGIAVSVGQGSEALCLDTTTISPRPGQTTPWAVGGGDGAWSAVPLPPATTVPVGAKVQIVLADVIINNAYGDCTIKIKEVTSQTGTSQVVVRKTTPAVAGHMPVITDFSADPDLVGPGGHTTLSYSTQNATQLILTPGKVDLSVPAGRISVPVDDTTDYTLYALSPGGRASQTVTVAVAAATIDTFAATPANPVPPGTPVTLQWDTSCALECSVDQGIGPVAVSGSTSVTPQQTTTYTLTVAGPNPVTSSVTVDVAN